MKAVAIFSLGALLLFSCRKDDTSGKLISERPDEFFTSIQVDLNYTEQTTHVHSYCYTPEEVDFNNYFNYLALDPNAFISYDGVQLPNPWNYQYTQLDGIIESEVFFKNYDGQTYSEQVPVGDPANFASIPDTVYKGEKLEVAFSAPNNSGEDIIQVWNNGGPGSDYDTEYYSTDSTGSFSVSTVYFTAQSDNTILMTRSTSIPLSPWPGAGGWINVTRSRSHTFYME